VETPLIDKRNGQIIAMTGDNLQIMDLETFEVFETALVDEEAKPKVRQGVEVEYWKVLGRTKVVRVKG
jgi:translation initiation factor 5A